MGRVDIRERQRIKQRQLMIRKLVKIGFIALFSVLLVVFLVRGVILPLIDGSGGSSNSRKTAEDDAVTYEVDDGGYQAVRIPVKSDNDSAKTAVMNPGWHDNSYGRWYQNPDGTFYADGFQEIDGVQYSFDTDGYLETGWIYRGANEYYFNEDGSYDPDKKRPMLALTFDDGPSQYTMELLNCLEEYNAHATFFMLGQLVGTYQDEVRKMAEIGCELGNHSYDHSDQLTLSLDAVYKQFNDTDSALIEACGQASTVARAPYGNGSEDIYNTVGKPFILWSLDTMDWSLMNADADFNSVMNSDLSDGTIILMHDIHQPSVEAALRLIPALTEAGYRLVTIHEMAEAHDVDLQNTAYTDFWRTSLDSGKVAGYKGSDGTIAGTVIPDSSVELTDSSEDESVIELTDGAETDEAEVTGGEDTYEEDVFEEDVYEEDIDYDEYDDSYYEDGEEY